MLSNKFNPNLVYKKTKFTKTNKIALIYLKSSSEKFILIINKNISIKEIFIKSRST